VKTSFVGTSFVETKNLKKTFFQGEEPLTVLKDVTIKFEQGKTYAITGASGSGKSTFLHLIGGLDSPTSGSVNFNNQNIVKSRSSLGFVFQFHYLINELTVLENISLMGLIHNKRKQDCIEKAKKLLEQFGLSDKANNHPFQLSGGEQQRVSILRAIFNQPDFLLADEPTGNLDSNNAKQIVDFFLKCKKDWNMGLVICSHDKDVYGRMENIFELGDGELKLL